MKPSARSPLAVLFFVVFLDLVGFGIVIPILPYYAKSYGASATELGWLMTVYSGMQFFFAPVWGRLSDRYGRRPTLLVSIFGTSVGLAILGAAPTLAWLFFGRTLAGICGANISIANAYVADVTPEKDRAKGMGMIGAAFGLGFIFGPAIGGMLSRGGYWLPMYFAATMGLVNLVFAFFLLPEPPVSAETREKNRVRRFDLEAVRETMGDFRTRRAILIFFLVTLAVTQMEVTFAFFMMRRYGLDAHGAGWLLAFMGTLMVLVQGGLIGKLAPRFGEIRLVIVGTAAMCAGLVIFGRSWSMAPVFTGLALLALGHGMTHPSLSSLASKGARPERRGATMGVFQSAGALARVFGPPMAGFAYDRVGMESPFLMAATLAFVACSTLVVLERRWLWKFSASH